MRIVCDSCGEVAEAVLHRQPDGAAAVTCGRCGARQPLSEEARDVTAPTALEPPEAEKDAAAWQAVLSRWQDEAAHRDYLARFADLEGLGRAGRRYRGVLGSRPSDPVALRWRDEILKRAAVQGLSLLPRTRKPRPVPRWARAAILAMASAALVLLGWNAVTALLAMFQGGSP